MWLMTRHGFYSVVRAHNKDKSPHENLMMVRGRSKGHLEQLKTLDSGLGEIVESGGTDYPYRIIVPRDLLLSLMLKLSMDIDYINFKNAASSNPMNGGDYIDFLHITWAQGLHLRKTKD